MAGRSDADRAEGFGAFFRRYTRTWQHAVATAALTAFGTLTFVHRLFAVLAILAYVLPPVVLYLREGALGSDGASDEGREEATDPDRPRTADGAAAREDGSRTDDPDEAGESNAAVEERGEGESDRADPERRWRTATAPAEESLLDAAVDGASAYAVGAEGAVLADGGEGWTCPVPDGPGAGSNALRGVDAVEGGGVWFAGDGGAVGRLDSETGRHVDHSAPDGDTSDVVDVAAAAEGGSETVLLVDGSGRVRRGRYRDGEVAWEAPTTPGSGSSLVGVVLVDGSTGYAGDTNQCVFETTDGGRTFEAVSPDGVAGTLTDVAASTAAGCAVSDDAGVVHRRDGSTWTPERLGEDPLWALARDGERGVAVGDGGAVYELVEGETRWERASTPTTVPLWGVALAPTRTLAVGGEGTVLERSVGRGGSDGA